jgi:copper transport protein
MRRRLLALGLLLGTLLGTGLVLAGSAAAHATLVTSDPVDGSRLKNVPSLVTITFDEPVGLGSIGYLHVTDQNGRRVDTGATTHPGGDGTKIAQQLKSGLGDGTYIESFRVVSADSHPVAGSVRFVVGNGSLAATVVDTSTVDGATSLLFDIARWVSYAGLALLGGSWLLLSVWPQGRADRRARRIVWSGVAATVVGAVAELLLQGPYTAGTGPSDVAKWAFLDGTLHTRYGQYHSVRLVLLGVAALLLAPALERGDRRVPERGDRRVPERGERRLPVQAAVLVLLAGAVAFTFSAIGHAATTSPEWLSEAADLLHICAMAAWVGGLAMVVAALLPRREPAELRAVLPVFSRVAFAAVLVMAATGTYAAWRGIGTLHAIFATTYGLLVVTKVALFVGLVLLGNVSRRAVQRRYARLPVAYAITDTAIEDATDVADEPVEVERVRRAVLVEIVLAIGVLVATSVLVAQPRGKEAVAIQQQRPASASAPLGGGRTATVTIEPGRHGLITATVALGPGARATAVTATATLPAKQLGPIPMNLTANGPDLYGASGVNLPVAGKWVITLVVTTSPTDAVTTSATVHLN